MLARLCGRTAQISVAALGVAWAAAASAEPGLSGNSASRSGAHNFANPAPRYASSPTPLASPNSASFAPGRSYGSGLGQTATASAGPNYAPGPVPSNRPAPPVGSTASSISADTPNLVTSLNANPAAGPGTLSTAATTTPGLNTSTFQLADRNSSNSPISVALGSPEGQTLPAPKAPLPQQAIITNVNGSALEPTAPSLVAFVRREEPCDGLRLTPDCRPQGSLPFLSLGVPQPRWGSLLSGKDERVPLEPTDWPWHAIGRVNVADSVSRRFCTGTLVGPQLVLTAGQCLFDYRLGRWVKPDHVHFVVGQVRDSFLGYSKAVELIVSPDLQMVQGTAPQRRVMRRDLMAHDWALIRLQDPLPVKPLSVRRVSEQDLRQEAVVFEMARAGYGADRPYLLSVHRGCSAGVAAYEPGLMLNECDSRAGDSGSPILLLRAGEAFLIGLSSGATFEWSADTGYVALAGLGASAASFGDALTKVQPDRLISELEYK